MSLEPDQDPDRRHSDRLIIELNQKFSDFEKRYDRDVGALNEWRRTTENQLKAQDKILEEIAPVYRKGIWVGSLFVIGSIGIAVKSFWSHMTWHP